MLDLHAGPLIWTIITFLVVFIILKSTVWKPLLAAIEAREKRINDALEGAEKAREEALAAVDEHRKRLEQAEDEARDIVRQSREAAEKVHQDIVEQARADAQQTVEQARRSIESEKQAAIAALRREMADLAVQAAGMLIDANLDDEQNRKLVDGMIDRIPQTPANNN
mgnify:FL=1